MADKTNKVIEIATDEKIKDTWFKFKKDKNGKVVKIIEEKEVE
ncbi:MAG: hypothetical protein ACK5NU_16340 [Fusobacterium ulcerans]